MRILREEMRILQIKLIYNSIQTTSKSSAPFYYSFYYSIFCGLPKQVMFKKKLRKLKRIPDSTQLKFILCFLTAFKICNLVLLVKRINSIRGVP